MFPQNRLQSCSRTSAAPDASSCCSPTRIWSRTGAPTTSGGEASNTSSATRGHCCHHFLSARVCSLAQAGPPAPDGAGSPSHHRHHVGGPVQTYEPRGQAAVRRAPAPHQRAHLEAQLCGRTGGVGRINRLTLTHAAKLHCVFKCFL